MAKRKTQINRPTPGDKEDKKMTGISQPTTATQHQTTQHISYRQSKLPVRHPLTKQSTSHRPSERNICFTKKKLNFFLIQHKWMHYYQ